MFHFSGIYTARTAWLLWSLQIITSSKNLILKKLWSAVPTTQRQRCLSSKTHRIPRFSPAMHAQLRQPRTCTSLPCMCTKHSASCDQFCFQRNMDLSFWTPFCPGGFQENQLWPTFVVKTCWPDDAGFRAETLLACKTGFW